MSTAIATEIRYTPEDLLGLPDGKCYELADGRLVERKTGAESGLVGGELYLCLATYSKSQRLGVVWPADNGYPCFPHAPGLVRRPDVSFVRSGPLPGDVIPLGWIRIPPDLAVEVVSPNDLAEELEEKLEDYRKAGVPLVWVIYPRNRLVKVFRLQGPPSELREDDELSGEDIIPGFRCPVRDILPPRQPVENAPDPAAGPNGASPG